MRVYTMCTHLRSLMRWCRTNQLEIVSNEIWKRSKNLIWSINLVRNIYCIISYSYRYNNTHIEHWDMVKLNYKFNSENCEIHIRKTICWLIFFTFAWMSRMNDGCRSIDRNLGLPFHSNVSTFHHPAVGSCWNATFIQCRHILLPAARLASCP